ncbi:hypothetical protein IE077_000490 [Cardiosporidium cionae]|uniref:Rubredoxin-like domain-containing protein n=1 Tax=Cardiosporidium cionae TaxID=476202 RepID=A0ABQ7J8Z8_9APIC|nr:hypothetical protein IE077_000490 [Cardiosporidium cionae]|eukprot:KAF8820429.1 hypothetical protein IE077_000490 [Cardiosporidium cionae]
MLRSFTSPTFLWFCVAACLLFGAQDVSDRRLFHWKRILGADARPAPGHWYGNSVGNSITGDNLFSITASSFLLNYPHAFVSCNTELPCSRTVHRDHMATCTIGMTSPFIKRLHFRRRKNSLFLIMPFVNLPSMKAKYHPFVQSNLFFFSSHARGHCLSSISSHCIQYKQFLPVIFISSSARFLSSMCLYTRESAALNGRHQGNFLFSKEKQSALIALPQLISFKVVLIGIPIVLGGALLKLFTMSRGRSKHTWAIIKTTEEARHLHKYVCENCGFTIFPARGREFKFFATSFTCPCCNASKAAFYDGYDSEAVRTQLRKNTTETTLSSTIQ